MEKITGARVRADGGFAAKWENFLYYNKWKMLALLFCAAVVAVILGTALSRERYDAYVLYAGESDVGRRTSGATSDYQLIRSALNALAADADGNGEVSVNFQPFFVMTAAQMEAFSEDGKEVNVRLVQDNTTALRGNLVIGDYYIVLLSEAVYRAYGATGTENALFADLAVYAGDGAEFVAPDAIRLSSVSFGQAAGVKNLPADTVICFRKLSEVSDTKKNRRLYEVEEDLLRAMLRT